MRDRQGPSEAVDRESREKERKPASFHVRIDRGLLAQLAAPEHVTDFEHSTFDMGEDDQAKARRDEAEAAHQARVDEIKEFFERLGNLPEELDFKPGITLIVGENGSGKSMLARALYEASQYGEMYKEALGEGSNPTEATEYADSMIRSNDPKRAQQAGLGPMIAAAMRESQIDAAILPDYMDIGSVYGEAVDRGAELARGRTRIETVISESRTHSIPVFETGSLQDAKSTRQSVDEYLEGFKEYCERQMENEHNRDDDVSGAIMFVDEPETGLSPRRHHEIEKEILSMFEIGKDPIIVVPTNSVVLFDSDLPRIDLALPERGIHRPSEYPDHDEVKA